MSLARAYLSGEYCKAQSGLGEHRVKSSLRLWEAVGNQSVAWLRWGGNLRGDWLASEKKHLNANLCIGDLNVNIRGMEVSPDCLAPVGAGVSLARAPKWLCIWDVERRREERSPDTAPPAPGSQLVSGSGTGPGLWARLTEQAGGQPSVQPQLWPCVLSPAWPAET